MKRRAYSGRIGNATGLPTVKSSFAVTISAMGNTAGWPAVVGGGLGKFHGGPSGRTLTQLSERPDRLASDLHDAWRLAYLVVVDFELAGKAVSKAFVEASRGETTSLPSRVELLEATLRISLTRAAENPDVETDSAVTAALWRLSAQQRAALWLTTVHHTDTLTLGAVLGLTAPNAGHVAGRAKEWLEVALDHESGPMCEREVNLDDYTQGRLAGDGVKEFEQHLPVCPTCRTRLGASKELDDLKAVLDAAVPQPPGGLTIEALQTEQRERPDDGVASLAEPAKTPALRLLAACVAALLIVAVVAIGVIRPGTRSSDPTGTSDPRAILPSSFTSAGGTGSPPTLPPATAATVVVTTTSIPTVTFPTIGGRKGKP